MWFISWLSKRRRPAPGGGRGPSRTRSSCRPRLEVLEDRTLLNGGYVFSTIDAPNGQSGTTVPLGINNRGDVVGDYSDASGAQHGYLLSGGRYTTLDVPNSLGTYASGINDRGQIVGTYYDASGAQHGFLRGGGQYTTLDDPNGVGSTVAEGINARGQIVGTYTDAGGAQHGFLFSGGKYTTLDDPNAAGGGFTVANGINDRGQIVGTYADANSQHGFLFSGGKYTTIDAPNAVFTAAQGINASGQIVGYYADASALHGFVLSGGNYNTLDDANASGLNVASGINDSGQIVGYYNDANGGNHGFLATRSDGVSGTSIEPDAAVAPISGPPYSSGHGTGGRLHVISAAAAAFGGGIYNAGTLTFSDNVFCDNFPDNIYGFYTDGSGNTFS